jgi:hypothetical protein
MGEQRKVLTTLLEPVMLRLSKQCAGCWSNAKTLDEILHAHLPSIPYCHLVYAIDKCGKQVSANVGSEGIDLHYRYQDLSRRPYSVSLYPKRHFMLSSVYVSQTTGHPCISAVQPVIDDQQFLGFVVADFAVHHLPLTPNTAKKPLKVLSTAVLPQRVTSMADLHLDKIAKIVGRLMSEYGVFHCTIHYTSAQVLLWQMDEPFQYRLYAIEQILEPTIYHAFPRSVYPEKALISTGQIKQVLERFSTLRLASEVIYLRTGSFNIMNGLVGLSFSCEGSQYLLTDMFLDQDLSCWLKPSSDAN